MSPWITLFIAIAITLVIGCADGHHYAVDGGHYLPLAPSRGAFAVFPDGHHRELWWLYWPDRRAPGVNLGLHAGEEDHFYYFIWLVVLGALWCAANLLDSRPGRAIRALKQGSTMVEAFGVHPGMKTAVFVIAAVAGLFVGWLYAHLQRFVNPTPFGINQGIEYLFMAGWWCRQCVGAVLRRHAGDAAQDLAAGLAAETAG